MVNIISNLFRNKKNFKESIGKSNSLQKSQTERKNAGVHRALVQAGVLAESGVWRWGYNDEVCISNAVYPHISDVFKIHFQEGLKDECIVESIEDLGSGLVIKTVKAEPMEEESIAYFNSVLDSNSDFICQLNQYIEDSGSFDVYGQALNGGEILTKRQCHALEEAFQQKGYIVKLVDYDRGIFTLEFPVMFAD